LLLDALRKILDEIEKLNPSGWRKIKVWRSVIKRDYRAVSQPKLAKEVKKKLARTYLETPQAIIKKIFQTDFLYKTSKKLAKKHKNYIVLSLWLKNILI
jgi:hypothetical protein